MAPLEKKLGLFSVISISISSMIGSGIFILPSIGIAVTGPSLFVAFTLAALIILPAAMVKAELVSAMPQSGGTYIYVERTFGPLWGTVTGLGVFCSILFKAAFSLFGLGIYYTAFSSSSSWPIIAVSLAIILILNILGVGKVSSFLNFFLGLTILALIAVFIFALPHWERENLTPFFPHGFSGLTSAVALVFVSYAGVTKVASIAEEVKHPEKNLPLAIFFSLFFVAIIYCGIALTLSAVFPVDEMIGEMRPIYVLADKVSHAGFAMIIAMVAVITMANTSNSAILAASRFPFAMSKDKLLPSVLGKLHQKFLTPISSILFSGIIVAVVLLTMDVVIMAKVASIFLIFCYLLENICVIILREAKPLWYTPKYRSPWYPTLQLFGIVSTLVLLFYMGMLTITAILSIFFLGLVFYFAYSRKRIKRMGVLGMKTRRADLIERGERLQLDDFYSLKRRAQVVVGLFGGEQASDVLVDMGTVLAQSGHVEVASIIEVPEQTQTEDILEESRETRSLRRRVQAVAVEKRRDIYFDSIVTQDLAKTICDIGRCVHCHWLMIEWRGWNRGALTINNPVGWLRSHLGCHFAVYKDARIRYIKKILVVVYRDDGDGVVLKTAAHLARSHQATLTLVEVVKKKADGHLKQLEQLVENVDGRAEAKILISTNPVSALIDESYEHDMLVIRGGNHSFINSMFGAMDDKIMAKAACSVLAVHPARNMLEEKL